ncbi:HdeA/HdeB family chaperone [Sphingomonas azotifigens]|uniref:HdeA/HdeB family chaperone n=1 Tax=Sphingomonas azotifigens TaxID=330920 RepID=UPI001431E6A0|nr:HdeA/HdeB family chaperone [Sphingomonas azotifigens]
MNVLAVSAFALVAFGAPTPLVQAQQSGATVKDGVVVSHQFVKTRGGEEEVTCEGFVGLADAFKPQAVAYAIGYNRAKHPEEAVVEVSGVEALVPVVVSACVTTPAVPLHQAVAKTLKK